MGNIYFQALNQPENAELFFQTARRIKTMHKGVEHSSNINALTSLAEVAIWKREYEIGLELYQEAMALTTSIYGDQYHLFLRIFRRIGELNFNRGNLEEALKYYEKALQRNRALDQPTENFEFIINRNIGNTLFKQGKLEQAVAVFEQNINAILHYESSTNNPFPYLILVENYLDYGEVLIAKKSLSTCLSCDNKSTE